MTSTLPTCFHLALTRAYVNDELFISLQRYSLLLSTWVYVTGSRSRHQLTSSVLVWIRDGERDCESLPRVVKSRELLRRRRKTKEDEERRRGGKGGQARRAPEETEDKRRSETSNSVYP